MADSSYGSPGLPQQGANDFPERPDQAGDYAKTSRKLGRLGHKMLRKQVVQALAAKQPAQRPLVSTRNVFVISTQSVGVCVNRQDMARLGGHAHLQANMLSLLFFLATAVLLALQAQGCMLRQLAAHFRICFYFASSPGLCFAVGWAGQS